MRQFLLALLGTIFIGHGAVAQTAPDAATLGEIRAEIELLRGQIDALRQELVLGNPADSGLENPAPILERVDGMERELRTLTDQVEELQFRVERIVADGTNRIGDLEFRLLELEGGDFSRLSDPVPLGEGQPSLSAGASPAPEQSGSAPRPRLRDGELAAAQPEQPAEPAPSAPLGAVSPDQGGQIGLSAPVQEPVPAPQGVAQGEAPELAISEKAAYDEAMAAYNAGHYMRAAQLFAEFQTDYPGGPLAGEAAFWRGEALAAQGEWSQAARSFLDSFSGAPQGPMAPEALYRLGVSLGQLGQRDEACLTLAEVERRYPDISPALAASAAATRSQLGCF